MKRSTKETLSVPDAIQLTSNGHVPPPLQTPEQEAWDLDSLRLSQDFGAELGGQKILTVVPVRKPNRQEFFRVHPSEEWRFPTALLSLKEERGESYLIAPRCPFHKFATSDTGDRL